MSGFRVSLIIMTACASPSGIEVTVPDRAPADGAKAILVVAKPTFRGVAMADGTDVRFRADRGSFSQTEMKAEVSTKTAGGEARAELFPPDTPGELKLTISFTNPNREPISRDVIITLERIEAADPLQVSLGCEASAIGALVPNAPALSIDCALTMRSKGGASLAGGQAKFYAEAGTVKDGGGQADGTRRFIYSVTPGSAPPVDVPPMQKELAPGPDSAQYLVTFANNQDYNPRDAVVTLLAVVRAHEAFEDFDGNGKFDVDVDTLLRDEPEPFLDVDDDGEFNAAAGDKFIADFDVNKNGSWDGPNGQFDADTLIGRSTHILWTGEPTLAARPPDAVTISSGQTRTVHVYLLDANGNPPAGFGATDRVQLTMNTVNAVTVSGLIDQLLTPDIGMTFDPVTGAFEEFTRDTSSGFPKLHRFGVTVTNNRMAGASTQVMTLSGSVRFSPFPPDQSSVSRTVQMTPLQITLP